MSAELKRRPVRIFFSVGEPSGDVHAANLIREITRLRPDVEAVGYGGPRMAAAGCRLHADLTRLAVMWFLRVLWHLPTFLHLLREAQRYFRQQRPDLVVLVDYPGFNWLIARRAKALGIPVVYFMPPQIWAWASWRIKKMRRDVDLVLCGLPFEETWFRERGVDARWVGHPFFDEVSRHQLDRDFVAAQTQQTGPLVAILPGSRKQEIEHNLIWFLRAAAEVQRQVPRVRFAVAALNEPQAALAQSIIADAALPLNLTVHAGKTPELMHLAQCCLAVSGSVSLELLHHLKPTVVLYWISPVAYFIQGFFRHTRFITLVNLLATPRVFTSDLRPYDPHSPEDRDVPFPEYLTCEDRSSHLAAHIATWLTQPQERDAAIQRLRDLRQRFGQPHAVARSAAAIVERLPPAADPLRAPHFAAARQAAPPADHSTG